MLTNQLESPIILIGTHRSGTSWLFNDVFSRHPDLACWKEPRYVWEWGNNFKLDDVLTANDARQEVIEHIRTRFAKFVKVQAKKRLFEKSPSNCLRLTFINKVYPRAKIIHVIRDGRAVFASSSQIIEKGYYRQEVLSRRLLEMIRETPTWAIPAYIPSIFEIGISKLFNRKLKYWGTRPSGWRDWLDSDSPNVVLAKQWSETINQSVDDAQIINHDFYYRFYYEDLINKPKKIMTQIIDFVELDSAGDLVTDVVKSVNPEKQDQWINLIDQATLEEIKPYIEPTLNKLGYIW